MHQRLGTRFKRDQAARRWTQLYPPAASGTQCGHHGAGRTRAGCCRASSRRSGSRVRGWSRSPKTDRGGRDLFAGEAEFDAFLGGTDILVSLLPLTPETTGILNTRLSSKLRRVARRRTGDRQRGARRASARGRHRRGARRRHAGGGEPRRVRDRAPARRRARSGTSTIASSRRTSRRSAISMQACAISRR